MKTGVPEYHVFRYVYENETGNNKCMFNMQESILNVTNLNYLLNIINSYFPIMHSSSLSFYLGTVCLGLLRMLLFFSSVPVLT